MRTTSRLFLSATLGIAASVVFADSVMTKTTSIFAPNEWKDKSVRYEADLAWAKVEVKVNGKDAGTMFDPDGSVEISPFLQYGKSNTVETVIHHGRGKYFGRDDYGTHNRNSGPFVTQPQAVARTAAYLDDVYLRASFDNGKKLIARYEVESLKNCKAEVTLQVFDDVGKGKDPATAGAQVKSWTSKLELKKGYNEVEFTYDWPDAKSWEVVPNAKCYVAKASMKVDGKDCDSRKAPFLFGFREVKRVGKEIYLNGHIQRFRGFWQQGQPKNANDVHKYGYNLAFETHKHWVLFDENEGQKNEQARAGIAVYSGMPSIYFVHDELRKDPECTTEWRRFLKHYWRIARNMPSIIASSCGVNQICPERNMRPEILGQDPEKGGVVDNIEFAAAEARKLHPNCLYFSHADGTEGDISTSNLYFNFTPLQEREEWLSSWAENGILPWGPVEFGAPYYACWFHSRTPQMTEWLAAYYGEKAYEAEDDKMLFYANEFAKDCMAKTHGGWVNNWKDQLFSFNPLGREYSKMLVYRTNRSWRTYGQNVGIMYLDAWKWDDPDPMRDRQIQANGDLVTFLGGYPAHTDRTHAYRSGEKIEKQLIAVWDGFGEKKITAKWKLGNLKSGTETFTVKQGEVAKKLLSIEAPSVKQLTKYRFEVEFSADIDRTNDETFATVEHDSFDVEIYPAGGSDVGKLGDLALFDPEGESAKMLDALGIKYTLIDKLDVSSLQPSTSRLIIGRRALSHVDGLEKLADNIANGLKVLVLPQTAAVWQSMGFQVEDMMPRVMRNVELNGLDETSLAHWRGMPMWDKDFGLVMKHATRRGPRWMHTHALGGLALLIPQKAGFKPLVRGEFDLSYTMLLKELLGKGSVTFCTFDFEGRVGAEGCPAATATAQAMFRNFAANEKQVSSLVFTDGEAAKRLADSLGLASTKYDGKKHDNALIIAGPDASAKFSAFNLSSSTYLYTFANDRLAGEAGLQVTPETNAVYTLRGRDNWNKFPFAGVGPQHFRFRDKLIASKYTAASGFTVTGNGRFAIKGNVLFDAIDPYQLADRYRSEKGGQVAEIKRSGGWGLVPKDQKDLFLRNVSQSEDNQLRRIATIFANWGFAADPKLVARSLYTKPEQASEPLAQYNVLGPWPSKDDDSVYMIDTVDFPVDKSQGGDPGSLAEKMAIEGDVQPNPRFYPEGLVYLDSTPADLRFIDWRPVIKPNENGMVDLRSLPLVAAQSFNTCYCVGFLKREAAGKITLRFGIDWRGRVWVNGKEVLKTYGGTKDEGSIIVEDIPVKAGENVITVKAGSGQSASTFYLSVTKEIKSGDVQRARNEALDGLKLYETANPSFDPYEYVYW